MKTRLHRLAAALCLLLLASAAFASAYNARPKLVVVIIIDQFRGDYLERFRDQFGPTGFRLLLDKGAFFTNCNYEYANTRTSPGNATLFTGTYSPGHGIMANEWWDPVARRTVAAARDDGTKLLGIAGGGAGASPHHLLADTIGDELKLATQGKARVFAVSLKVSAAVLPGGFSADAAYWTDHASGAFVTSTYYMKELPEWVTRFNAAQHADKYWNLEWKDGAGNLLRTTSAGKDTNGNPLAFYDVVGATPFANDYEIEFARELIVNENLGSGPATDLLVLGLSANDILGHKVGPDSPEVRAMTLATDRQLQEFFAFLGRQIGLANVWIALSADHGIAPLPAAAAKLRIPAVNLNSHQVLHKLNAAMTARFSPGQATDYVPALSWPVAFLSEEAFTAARVKEEDAERAVGEALRELGLRAYYTRAQLLLGAVPPDALSRKYLHSYSPYGGWYLFAVPAPFSIGYPNVTDHSTPYTYDTHVPLAFYGAPFRPGAYHTHCEPVDMVSTLASLLGINAPSHAIGRVLTEALVNRESAP